MSNMHNDEFDVNDLDAGVKLVNNLQRREHEERLLREEEKKRQEKLASLFDAQKVCQKSLANNNSKPTYDKTRIKKMISIGLKILAAGAVVGAAIAINSALYKDTNDFNKACDSVKEEVYEILLENDLATRDEDGNVLIDNTINDYYRLDLAHADKYEKYAYYLALGKREFNEAIKTIGYVDIDQFLIQNDYYTTTNVYNGLDLHGGRFASESKFTEDVRDEYIEAYRNGTLDEIVRDDPIKGRSH